MKRIRSKVTYSNVVSTVCLCLLVGGGTAFAATRMLPKNSVGSKQLKKNSVGSKQLKKGAVTPAKLSEAAKGAMTGPKGATGAVGPIGATGAAGPKGATGAPGAPATALWAEVNGQGNLVKGSGATGSHELFTGAYEVDFNRNVTACTYQATSSENPGAIVLVEPRFEEANGVYVDLTETVGGSGIEGSFDLAVFC